MAATFSLTSACVRHESLKAAATRNLSPSARQCSALASRFVSGIDSSSFCKPAAFALLRTGAGRAPFRSMSILRKLFGGGDAPSSNGDGDVLKWARAQAAGTQMAPKEPPPGLEYATVAGGCFWGVELAFQRVPGVVATAVGYTQGNTTAPTYEQVCSGRTGHTEAVLVTYDPKECKFETLVETFLKRTDVTQVNGQGNDWGTQYRTGIYHHSDAQKEIANKYLDQLRAKNVKVASEVKPALDFWLAESYHQQYLAKGGRFNRPQSAAKNCTDPIRCYG